VIISFQHKGLRLFYETGSARGITPSHVKRLARILSFLEQAGQPADMDLPGWHLHPLKGQMEGYWAVSVSGNWRVIFRFVGHDVELVDYLDYH